MFRRIGYTDGLYDIFRFGEVVKENHSQLPTSVDVLAQFILRRYPGSKIGKQMSPQYAKGMVDVLTAFGILQKMGPKVWLTNHGRALVALIQDSDSTYHKTARYIYFLKTVLASDGDYILNLLALIDQGVPEHDLGQKLFEKMLKLVEYRKREILKKELSELVQNDAQGHLDGVAKGINAILNPEQPSHKMSLGEKMRILRERSRFARKGWKSKQPGEHRKTVEHTVKPRTGWLSDLGLTQRERGKAYSLSQYGHTLLRLVSKDDFRVNNHLFRMPFSEQLLSSIGLPGILPAVPNDYWIELGARIYVGQNLQTYPSNAPVEEFLDEVYHFFQLVKLKAFNQADVEAIYEAMAIKQACKGFLLKESTFNDLVRDLVAFYPDKVHWMSHRRGGGGYLAFKKPIS